MRISDWSSDVCSSDLRVRDLRVTMREGGISDDVPIVMAGGVWALKDWNDWIDNPELGAIMFQFGTRSEEHTSELQSLMRISYAVFCLKKKKKHPHTIM